MVAGSPEVEGVAGGELRGGGGFGDKVIFGPRWSPTQIDRGVALARGRKGSWWREWRGRGTSGDGIGRGLAATEPAGLGEEGLPLLDCWLRQH